MKKAHAHIEQRFRREGKGTRRLNEKFYELRKILEERQNRSQMSHLVENSLSEMDIHQGMGLNASLNPEIYDQNFSHLSYITNEKQSGINRSINLR